MVNGRRRLSSQVKHAQDFDSDTFGDPGGWNKASYSAHPIDSIEPLSDEPNPYRQAALHFLKIMWIIDEFITAAPDARAAVVAVGIVLRWPSVRGLSVGNIAGQLGCSPATVTRACAKFREMSGLAGGGVRFIRPGAGEKPTSIQS
jgi:hypothetical protein